MIDWNLWPLSAAGLLLAALSALLDLRSAARTSDDR